MRMTEYKSKIALIITVLNFSTRIHISSQRLSQSLGTPVRNKLSTDLTQRGTDELLRIWFKSNKRNGHLQPPCASACIAPNIYRSGKRVNQTSHIKTITQLCESQMTHALENVILLILNAVRGAVGRFYTTSICRTNREPKPSNPDTPLQSHTCSP